MEDNMGRKRNKTECRRLKNKSRSCNNSNSKIRKKKSLTKHIKDKNPFYRQRAETHGGDNGQY